LTCVHFLSGDRHDAEFRPNGFHEDHPRRCNAERVENRRAPQLAMTPTALQRKETLLIEMLLSSLDLRNNAQAVGSPMLTQLADLLVARAREELDRIAVDNPMPHLEDAPAGEDG
jgi:hypothetical protein